MKHKRRNIVLIGFMGSGKTTLGLKLSYLLRMPVEDTDKLIERQEGRSITQIFADDGESYFRELETEVLRKCGSRKSRSMMKKMPITIPPAAGSHPAKPCSSACSIAGINKLQTEAAIITPAANPRKIRWILALERL